MPIVLGVGARCRLQSVCWLAMVLAGVPRGSRMAIETTVASTILAQLGGNRFTVMTGARNFVNHGNALAFRIPAVRGINQVIVRLNAFDTYDVEFNKVGKFSFEPMHYKENIYADQLRGLFTRITGLDVSL